LNVTAARAESVWPDLPSHYTNIILHEHIVMPDHFHAIIQIDNGRVGGNATARTACNPRNMALLNLFVFSARKINELRQRQGTPIWQRNYYEHIIRNDDDYFKTVNYIKENPARWDSEESLEK